MKKIITNLVKVASLIVLFVHFILTFIHVMPITPIKLEHKQLLHSTIGTFFPQNWSLFAPNPISQNLTLLVMCVPDNEKILEAKDLPNNGWEDITTPLWQGVQNKRLSAYGRIERVQSSAIRQNNSIPVGLESWYESCRKGSEESCKYFAEKAEEIKKENESQLIKIASSFCKETRSDHINQVAIRIRVSSKPSWSKRYLENGEYTDQDIGVFPINHDVVLSGVYKKQGGIE